MSSERADRVLRLLLDDYERQGRHLESAQVERVLFKRKLSPEEAVWVHERLQEVKAVTDLSVGDRDTAANEDPNAEPAAAATFDIDHLLSRAKQLHRPLSRSEESVLARRIITARETRKALEQGRIRPGPEAQRLISDGDEARDGLVHANLLFAAMIAKEYQSISSLDFDDLFQEGVRGLLRAVEKFDPSRNIKFISYAVWWVRQAIQSATMNGGHFVRLPINVHADLQRLRKVRRRISRLNDGANPHASELAEALEWDIDRVYFLLEVASFRADSVDQPLESKPSLTWGDVVADIAPWPDQATEEAMRAEAISSALSSLKERERAIIIRYFGLDGDTPMTLEAIAVGYGLTRERIRQIKERALVRLRHATRAPKLLAFFDEYVPEEGEGDPSGTQAAHVPNSEDEGSHDERDGNQVH